MSEADGFADLMYPTDIPQRLIPVSAITGPPASGKNTYIQKQAEPGDVLIDLDAIVQSLSGVGLYRAPVDWLRPALEQRNHLLRESLVNRDIRHLWFIATAPQAAERVFWSTVLGCDVVRLDVSRTTCERRARRDERRASVLHTHMGAITRWFDSFTPSVDDLVVSW